MDKTIIRTILIAGALTSMAFGAMYVVRRVRDVLETEEGITEARDPRTNPGYTAPVPTEQPGPTPDFIPVTIDVVDGDEDEEEEGEPAA